MPMYAKVEDSKSLTIKLPRVVYQQLREIASDRKVPPGAIVAEALQGFFYGTPAPPAPLPKAAPLPAAPRAPKPKAEGKRQRLSRDPTVKAQQIEQGREMLQRILARFDMGTIAQKLGVSDGAVRGWKAEGYLPLDRWQAVETLLKEEIL